MRQVTASHPPIAPRRQLERLVVPDVLRGVAILAMLVAHGANSLMPDVPTPVRMVSGQLNDLASPLFALVMGMAAQILLTRTVASSRGLLVLHKLFVALCLLRSGYGLLAGAPG